MMLLINNADSLPSVKSDNFLPPIHRWASLGGLAIVTLGVTVVGWAALTPYSTIVKASAIVRPIGEARLVQAAQEGTVETITLQVGDTVQQGSPIVILEQTQLKLKQAQLHQTIHDLKQQQFQIDTQQQSLDRQVQSESIVAERTVVTAKAELVKNQHDYTERQVIAKTAVAEAIANRDFAKVEMEKYQQLANTGAVAQLQVREKEQAFQASQARLDRAKASLHPSNAPITIATEQIAQNQAKGLSTQAALTQQKEDLQQQKLGLQQQINQLQQDLQGLKQKGQQQIITAPVTGKIAQLTIRNPGQLVKPGETIAQIVPTPLQLVIKAKISAQDIAKVQVCREQPIASCTVGQVDMRVDAYPYPDYGILHGVVREITPDTIAQAQTNPYYEATIEPFHPYLEKQGQRHSLQPGMAITAAIISDRTTVLTFLLQKARLLAGG